MKLLNGEVLGASQALEELSNKDFPIKVSYGIVTLINKLSSQVAILEQMRTDLIKKHGTKNEKDGSISIAPNTLKMTQFMDEFGSLLNEEVEIEFTPIVLPFEINGSSYNIEPRILKTLELFITME